MTIFSLCCEEQFWNWKEGPLWNGLSIAGVMMDDVPAEDSDIGLWGDTRDRSGLGSSFTSPN